MDADDPRRRGQWLKGVLELCVLAALADGERYGYDLARAIGEAGLGPIKGGTLYPLLARLTEAGLLEAEWRAGEAGPGRRFYALTPAGRDALAAQRAQWARFAAGVATLLDPTTTEAAP